LGSGGLARPVRIGPTNGVTDTLPRSAALIVNAKSRKGRHLFREACRLLREAGVELSRTDAVRDPKRFAGSVKAAVEAGTPMVIVGGGDGSISSSVDHVVGTDTIFAILPLGTANSLRVRSASRSTCRAQSTSLPTVVREPSISA